MKKNKESNNVSELIEEIKGYSETNFKLGQFSSDLPIFDFIGEMRFILINSVTEINKKIDLFEDYIKEGNFYEKTPYKCPVCNGNGIRTISVKIVNGKGDTEENKELSCNACNGKGIVWG